MNKDPKIFLHHILECTELIEEYTKNINFEEFEINIQVQDAVTRRIEIIGEATKNIPLVIKKNYPEVIWKDMAGMRDILIHRYYGVSLDVTWSVIKKRIGPLKKQIKMILKDLLQRCTTLLMGLKQRKKVTALILS